MRFSRVLISRGLLSLGLAFALFSATPALAQQPVKIVADPPELVGGPWLNTPKKAPIKLSALKGKVIIVEFWTFG